MLPGGFLLCRGADFMADPYDIPVKIFVQVGAGEPVEIISGGLRWPYNAGVELERVFRDAADALAVENGP
jgi:hypothetical protein